MLCSAYLSLLSYMAEIHASQLSRLHDEIFAKMSVAIEFAIRTHGTEIVRVCLELIASLATYAYEQKPMPEDSILCQFGNHFLKILFEMLLLETFDVDLMEVASNAVFTLLCCHQVFVYLKMFVVKFFYHNPDKYCFPFPIMINIWFGVAVTENFVLISGLKMFNFWSILLSIFKYWCSFMQ